MTSFIICLGVISALLIVGTAFFIAYKDSTYDKMSFKESMNLAELPIITFHSGNKKLNFILDTGSNRSVIDEVVVRKCVYKEEPIGNTLVGLDGIERMVANYTVMLSYNNHQYSELFQVSDLTSVQKALKDSHGVNIHGILGNSFFNKYKYVIDFEKWIAYPRKHDILSK